MCTADFLQILPVLLAVVDPDLELSGGGEEGCFACPAGFSSFCDFFFFTQCKIRGGALDLPLARPF